MNDEKIFRNRLWNARQLVRNAGGTNAAGAILGVRGSYVTAICGPKPTRTIGDRMAQKIERCFGIPPGALDMEPPTQSRGNDLYLSEIAATLANSPDEDKEFVLAISQWISSRSTARMSETQRAGTIDLSTQTTLLHAPEKFLGMQAKNQLSSSTQQTKKK